MDKLQVEIKKLAKEKNTIILAHNYQPAQIQDVANLVGDSLELSLKAKNTSADIIVFCGVHFMAETAAIVCPDKKVIIPRIDAGCQMADMLNLEKLNKEKEKYGANVPVVTYVNSTAQIKANSNICCTSANSIEVVNSLEEDEVLMVPDRNLAQWTAINTSKKIHYFNGYCPIHESLTKKDLEELINKYPDAEIMVHPECRPEVVKMAHVVKSTSGMLSYPKTSKAKDFIVATEIGMLHPLKKKYPDRNFIPASSKMICPDMKLISLEILLKAIEEETPVVKIEEDIRKKALGSVEKMLSLRN